MEERAMMSAQANLRGAINRQRNHRGHSDFGGLSTWPGGTTSDPRGEFQSQWPDNNSFLSPLDSRRGDLL